VAHHPLAGQPAPASMLVNIPRLITAYYTEKPDANLREQCVCFGTSGYRGTSFKQSFNKVHIVAVAQAIYEYRKMENISGPL
jgi:phosphoglucomutase